MSDQAPLVLKDITVRFGGVTALDGVSLDVHPAAITGLIGPNGAGKSTLLAVASGFQRPAAGEVFLHGKNVTGARPQNYAKARMARTFQSPQLVKELDIRQHVVLGMRSAGRARTWQQKLAGFGRGITADERTRADSLLHELGLSDVAEVGVSELPMGMRRLVEVAQCLACDPQVLLLDEPSAGLNGEETASFARLVSLVAQQRGIAVLLVEHDLDLVLSICARLFVLDFGKLIAQGTPAEMRSDRKVQDAYLGTFEEAS
jgi:branched-chain amino acid transport system ATP-binding protein